MYLEKCKSKDTHSNFDTQVGQVYPKAFLQHLVQKSSMTKAFSL